MTPLEALREALTRTTKALDALLVGEIELAEMMLDDLGARPLEDHRERREGGRRVTLDASERWFTANDVPAIDWYPDTGETGEANPFHDDASSSRVLVPARPQVTSSPVPDSVLERSDEAPDRFRLEVRTARELVSIPDPPESAMLVGPLVLRGGRTIVVGDTGHGKTSLALQLTRGVLTGEDVLGFSGSGVGPVLVVDLEQGLRSIKRSLRDAGLDGRDDVLYVTAPDGLALESDSRHLAELERVIAEHRPAVCVLDPYYKAHRGDANEERPVVDLMRLLDALRTRYGFALILPAHPRKDVAGRDGSRKLTLHDVSGSGAIVRGAEVVVGIERVIHGQSRLRILKDRDGDLSVGDVWPLIFSRGEGFRLDPKEERTAEQLEARITADSGDWRTVPEWAAVLKSGRTERRICSRRSSSPDESSFLSDRPAAHPGHSATGLFPGAGRSRTEWRRR